MITVVLAYADRLRPDAPCPADTFISIEGRNYTGRHFRSLLAVAVRSFRAAGASEVIVVNHNNKYTQDLRVEGARVINVNTGGRFSEWDAKLFGIGQSSNETVVTSNADIYCPRSLIQLCLDYLDCHPRSVFHGTKGWLNEVQTARLLVGEPLDCCRHEVVFQDVRDNEIPVDGVEPETWAARSSSAALHAERFGIDIWKNAGDFQAFNRDILDVVEYPTGSQGWGGGDTEFRLRAREAGIVEYWERRDFLWHLFHPVKDWRFATSECNSNFSRWGRYIDWSEGGFTGYAPPEPGSIQSMSCGRLCAAYPEHCR